MAALGSILTCQVRAHSFALKKPTIVSATTIAKSDTAKIATNQIRGLIWRCFLDSLVAGKWLNYDHSEKLLQTGKSNEALIFFEITTRTESQIVYRVDLNTDEILERISVRFG